MLATAKPTKGRFCCTYFGRISVCSDTEDDKSLVHIANYLLLKETSFTLEGVVEQLACTHNYAFFLIRRPTLKSYRIRIDGNTVTVLNFDVEHCEQLHFQRADIRVEVKSMKLTCSVKQEESCDTRKSSDHSQTCSKVPELTHCEENEKSIVEQMHNCDRPNRTNVPCGLICCTDTTCYLIANSENGPSLLMIFVENAINDEVKLLQIGCKEAIISLKAGKSHVLLLTASGMIYSFGTGTRGELGHGKLENEQMPKLIDVLSIIPVVEIACGSWHSVALTKDGDAYTWGWNCCGQMGSTDSSIIDFPLPLDIDWEIVAVSAYRNATLLKKADGDVVVLGAIGYDT
ncbi:unnamed protein product [Toxocara canis]|uniref:RCC1 domain-containing protein 1 n=1 Tax=Toxocara canis TaxID=6265 RepID=A0A183UA23_TOXCA|nr:unnamed protein product [Toxocara canis]